MEIILIKEGISKTTRIDENQSKSIGNTRQILKIDEDHLKLKVFFPQRRKSWPNNENHRKIDRTCRNQWKSLLIKECIP